MIWVILHNCSLIELPHQAHLLAHPEFWIPHAYDHFTQTGWAGVQLFFVLSGFLITRILLATRDSSTYLRDFFFRRILRIFPLYFLTLFLILIVLAYLPFAPEKLVATSHHQLALWLFLSNWVQPFGIVVFGLSHFWSLAVEEQFYLLWPFAIRGMKLPNLVRLSLLLIVLALLVRVVLNLNGVDREVTYQLTVCRMDGLLCGALVAMAQLSPRLREAVEARSGLLAPLAFLLLVVGAAATAGFELNTRSTQTIGYTFLGLAFAMLVARMTLPNRAPKSLPLPLPLRAFEWKALRSVGKYSYAMYVIHYPLDRYVFQPALSTHYAPGPPPFAADLLYGVGLVCLSYALGIVSYNLVEGRFLQMYRTSST